MTTPICRQEKICSERSSLFFLVVQAGFFGGSNNVPGLWRIFSHQCPSQWHVLPSFYIRSPTQGFCSRRFFNIHGDLLMPIFEKIFPVYTANVIKSKGEWAFRADSFMALTQRIILPTVPSGWFRLIALYAFLLLSHLPYSVTTGDLRLIYTADGKK